jgi:hypothetical protein
MNPLAASRATVQQKSSPDVLGRRLRKKKNGAELTNRAVTRPEIQLSRPAIQLFQPAIQLLQREIPLPPRSPLQRLLVVDWWVPDLLPAVWFRSFAHTPQGVRHWPECRYIFS